MIQRYLTRLHENWDQRSYTFGFVGGAAAMALAVALMFLFSR